MGLSLRWRTCLCAITWHKAGLGGRVVSSITGQVREVANILGAFRPPVEDPGSSGGGVLHKYLASNLFAT